MKFPFWPDHEATDEALPSLFVVIEFYKLCKHGFRADDRVLMKSVCFDR